MTTIAYRDGVLASDTQMSYADTSLSTPNLKLFIAGKYAVAVCGDCRMIPTIKRWFEQHDCQPKRAPDRLWDEGFDALAMDVNGDLFMLLADELHPLPCNFFAIGSGRLLALGAMEFGATAPEAVAVAAAHDVYTGEPVESISKADLAKALKGK